MGKKRVVIVGGGFGGIYTAMHLEKYLKKDDFDITLINRENYFVYQPMLAEIIGGSVGILDTVSSINMLCPKTTLFTREVASIDVENKKVEIVPIYTHKNYPIEYDYLVLSMGNVTDFRGAPGLHEHALPFKNLADSLRIRNRIIDVIATAATIEDPKVRKPFLTFIVGGGGYSGIEVVAELNDLARSLIKKHPTLCEKELRVALVHSKDHILERELGKSLSEYAEKLLRKKGVEFIFDTKLTSATNNKAVLSSGEVIETKTVISSVPSSPNPILEALNLPKFKGKIQTDTFMQVEGHPEIFALGDCAAVPIGDTICPPTAQFAVRQGKTLAYNLLKEMRGGDKKPFYFKALGSLGALGHHNAVAELFGKIRISGLLAWLMWRTIYWYKLPGFGRKIKVAVSWFLDMIVPPENVMLKIEASQALAQLHFEEGDIVFHEGDIGDYLYIIIDGSVDVLKEKEGKQQKVASLNKGEFFGEMALLNERGRTATIKANTATNLLALRKTDFGMLIANFSGLKHQFETAEHERK